MEIKTLTTGLSVSEQILPSDMLAIKDAGFRTIICNRPDGEGPDQPTFEEIARAAQMAGIQTSYIPVVPGQSTDDETVAFNRSLSEMPGPVLAYCRTGTRSTILWTLGQAGKRSVADILAATKAAGYDMSDVVQRIVNSGQSHPFNGSDLNST